MIRLLLFLSLPLYVIDQITKCWIVRTFELNGEGKVVVPDFFTLHHIDNTGIAFGQFNGGKYSNYIFGAVAIGALGLITWLYRKGMFPGGFSRVAIALLVAGVCGNFTDRLLHGYVVDFSSSTCTCPWRIHGRRSMSRIPAWCARRFLWRSHVRGAAPRRPKQAPASRISPEIHRAFEQPQVVIPRDFPAAEHGEVGRGPLRVVEHEAALLEMFHEPDEGRLGGGRLG